MEDIAGVVIGAYVGVLTSSHGANVGSTMDFQWVTPGLKSVAALSLEAVSALSAKCFLACIHNNLVALHSCPTIGLRVLQADACPARYRYLVQCFRDWGF
jgi:hypothetical protein